MIILALPIPPTPEPVNAGFFARVLKKKRSAVIDDEKKMFASWVKSAVESAVDRGFNCPVVGPVAITIDWYPPSEYRLIHNSICEDTIRALRQCGAVGDIDICYQRVVKRYEKQSGQVVIKIDQIENVKLPDPIKVWE